MINSKVDAIKYVRAISVGVCLTDARDIVEAWMKALDITSDNMKAIDIQEVMILGKIVGKIARGEWSIQDNCLVENKPPFVSFENIRNL